MIHTSFQIFGIFSLFSWSTNLQCGSITIIGLGLRFAALLTKKTALDIESQVSSFSMSKVMKSEVHSSALASDHATIVIAQDGGVCSFHHYWKDLESDSSVLMRYIYSIYIDSFCHWLDSKSLPSSWDMNDESMVRGFSEVFFRSSYLLRYRGHYVPWLGNCRWMKNSQGGKRFICISSLPQKYRKTLGMMSHLPSNMGFIS